MTNLSQRPKKIPMECLSESEHLFAFRLNLADDRKRLGEIFGSEHEARLRELDSHRLLYYQIGMDEPREGSPI